MDLTKVLSVVKSKKTGFFAAGVLFGTAGIKALSSKDAKKFYTNCTAAVLRAKECVMDTVATVQENAEDIYAEAQQINEERAAEAEEWEAYAETDEAEETEEVSEDTFKEVAESNRTLRLRHLQFSCRCFQTKRSLYEIYDQT